MHSRCPLFLDPHHLITCHHTHRLTFIYSTLIMDEAWNELSFDFEPAVQAALPPSSLGNTRDRFRTQVQKHTTICTRRGSLTHCSLCEYSVYCIEN